jgi:hypothetical protein
MLRHMATKHARLLCYKSKTVHQGIPTCVLCSGGVHRVTCSKLEHIAGWHVCLDLK